jgi:uncharacterized protein YciI
LSTFVVLRERGPAWDWSREMRAQDGWEEHAAFMERLVDEEFIRAGGMLADDRAMHVVEAESEEAVRARFAADPWPEEMLNVASVTPWEILLGGLR